MTSGAFGAGDLVTALILFYFIAVCWWQVSRTTGRLRAICIVSGLFLLPSALAIQVFGSWDLFEAPAFNDFANWWVVGFSGDESTPPKPVNLVTTVFLLSLLYVATTASIALLSVWHNRKGGGHIHALHQALAKWAVVVAGLLVYLKALDISLTPILVGMGAASIVVGLALQEPLSNLFAGLAIDMEGAIQRGEWVQIEGSPATVGKVLDKGWRTTKLLTLEGVLVTVPNRTLGNQKILNYHRPDPIHAHSLRVGASYKDPPVKVKEVLRTILLREPRILKDPAPEVRTVGYNDSSIDYEMRFCIRDYGQHRRIKDEVLTRVWYAFRYNGIEIPFPLRTVIFREYPKVQEEQLELRESAEDLAHFLKTLPFLGGHLVANDFAFLAQNAFQRTYGAGEHVVRRGTMGDALFVVRTGHCEVRLPSGGHKHLEAGEYFGEMGLLKVAGRSADVVAGAEGCTVVRLDRECMLRLFRYYPELRGEFEHTREARRKESGILDETRIEPVGSLRSRVRRAAREALMPWWGDRSGRG